MQCVTLAQVSSEGKTLNKEKKEDEYNVSSDSMQSI